MEEKFMYDKEHPSDVHDSPGMSADIHSENEPSGTVEKDAEIEQLKKQLEETKDRYVRLMADFDNFRKRTAKEKLELIQTASKDVIISLLEVLDDMERAEKQIQNSDNVELIKEGVTLVYNKLKSILQARGLRPMNAVGTDFNPDIHEAIAEIPAPSPEMKGKVIEEVEKGYYLNDKLIRVAKVVVGK
jgi:molecular chaperone GrpE